MRHFSKRLNALETKLSSQGPLLCFLAVKNDFKPMTEREIENEIARLRERAPANTRIEPMTLLPVCDPELTGQDENYLKDNPVPAALG